MATIAGLDGMRMTICPACGYPSAGLCSACTQILSAVPVPWMMNTFAGAPQFDPAA